MGTLNRILFWLALALCLACWTRLLWMALANPSPARLAEFVDRLGEKRPGFKPPRCHGSAVVDGPQIWQLCVYRQAAGQALALEGLVRFDLEAAQAQMHWPLPAGTHGQLVGVARLPRGEVLVLLADGQLFRAREAGGLERIGQAGPAVIGFGPVDERVELVYADGRVVSYGPEGEQPVGRAPQPAAGAGLRPGLAEWADDNWYLTWLLPPERPESSERLVEARLLCSDLDQPPQDCGQLQLPAEQVLLADPGQPPAWSGIALQPALGNLLPGTGPARMVLVRQGGIWTPLVAPASAPSAARLSLDSDAVLVADELVWLPRFVHGSGSWVGLADGWLELTHGPDGLAVARAGQLAPGPVVRDAWLDHQARLAPIPGGGLWLLGAYGTYLRLGADLSRADELSFAGRIVRVISDFDRLARFDDFYLEFAWPKRLTLPLVLLLWPLSAGLLFGPLGRVRLPRWDSRLALSLRVAAWIYLPVAGALLGWYWKLTAKL